MTSLPKYDDFYLPTLTALHQNGGSGSINEVDDAVAALMGLSQEQLDQVDPHSGVPIATDRMSWARSYLKIAGLVGSGGRGIWVLTDDGRHALSLSDAELKRKVADAYNVHNAKLLARRKDRAKAKGIGTVADPDAFPAEPAPNWSDQLLATLQAMDPAAFERLCQRLLRESGFVRVEVTGKSVDGGIDGNGVLRMNLISFQVLFQCKRYKGSVGSGTVRDFRGAMQGRADKGLIITTGTFTPDARREATRDGAPAIDLIDGEALTELLRTLKLGVVVEQVVTERITVEERFFAEI